MSERLTIHERTDLVDSLRIALDFFLPTHDRTSCSDADLNNAYPNPSSGAYRCVRCAVLSKLNLMEPEQIREMQFTISAVDREIHEAALAVERAESDLRLARQKLAKMQ